MLVVLKKILIFLSVPVLLADVAPCGGCGNTRPVDREQYERAEPVEESSAKKEKENPKEGDGNAQPSRPAKQ